MVSCILTLIFIAYDFHITFLGAFCVGLDVDGRQVGNGHVHS